MTYKLRFRGTAAYAASASGTTTVTVKPLRAHTTLSIVASRTRLSAGQMATIGGTLASGKTLRPHAQRGRHDCRGEVTN